MDSRKLYLETPTRCLFIMAAVPGAVSMLASSLWQTLDGVFVGQFVGTTAFAAINLAMPFVIVNFALADLIGVGSAVPISVALGRGDRAAANNAFTCATLLIVGTGAVTGAAMYLGAPALMSLMGVSGEFAELAVGYLRVYALFSPVTSLLYAVDNFLRISGFIRSSMVLNVAMSALSMSLELVLLAGLGWDTRGAALAGCAAMTVCSLAGYVPFLRGRATLRLCRPRMSLRLVRQIAACGSLTFLNNVAGRVTSIIMNAILVRTGGETAVSVYGVLMFVDGFVQPLLYGMCDSLQPAVGVNWGARRHARVRSLARHSFAAAAVVSLASAAVIACLPEPLARLFMTDVTPEALSMATGALALFSLTYVTRWFSFATQSFLMAIEKSLPASIVSVATALVFPVALVVALWPLGLTGIWLNFPLTSLLCLVLSAALLRYLRREVWSPDAS